MHTKRRESQPGPRIASSMLLCLASTVCALWHPCVCALQSSLMHLATYALALCALGRSVHANVCPCVCVCVSTQIKGYPTLKAMYKGESIKHHRGSRELKSLKSFIEEAAKEVLTEL